MSGTNRKFEDLLSSLKTGKWNLYTLFLATLWFMLLPFFVFSGAFTTPHVPHTCIATTPHATHHRDAATTTTTTTTPVFANNTSSLANETLDDEWSCSLPGDSSTPCTSWAFNNTVYGRTLTSEYELVCDRRFFRGLYSSAYYSGGILTSAMSGWMSDRFGRRKVFFYSVVVYSIIGNITHWIPNLTAILVLRFIMGMIHPATVQSNYSLVMEVFEERWRSMAGIIIFLTWPLGMLILAVVSFLVLDWRWLHFYLALPTILCLPLMWTLDESPRWLIVRGRHTEAHNVLKKAARWNNTSLPPVKDVQALMDDIRQDSADGSSIKREGRWQKLWRMLNYFTLLFRTRRIRKITLTIFFLHLISSMSYVGLSLGGDLFSSNPFVYMAVTGLMELPGSTFTIPIVERFGRRRSNVVCYFLTGVVLLTLGVTPTSLGWLVTTLALLGKLTLTAAYQIIYLHSAEVFPTEVRAFGMGNASMMARIGSVFASFLVSALPKSWSAAPSIIFGCASLLASTITLLLPETRGAALYDTVTALEAARPSRSSDAAEQGENLLQEDEKLQLTTTTTIATNSTVTTSTTIPTNP